MRCRRLTTKVENLRTQVARHTAAKTKEGRIEQEWIVRVILAAPHASGRAVAQAFRDVAGTDSCTVNRTTIGFIKDAWAETYREMFFKYVADLMASLMAAATQAK